MSDLKNNDRLFHKFDGGSVAECIVSIGTDGAMSFVYNLNHYRSISKAGEQAKKDRGIKGSCNGWDFWRLDDGTTQGAKIKNPNYQQRASGGGRGGGPINLAEEEDKIRRKAEEQIKKLRDSQIDRAASRIGEIDQELQRLAAEKAKLEEILKDQPAKVEAETEPTQPIQIESKPESKTENKPKKKK